jgi:4-hydroxy-tetrahydrodipicolinate reductase
MTKPLKPRTSIRLFINGARGKMGARISALAHRDERFVVAAAHDLDDIALADALPQGAFDALIDFSSDDGAHHAASLASKHGAALLVGTTGLSSRALKAIDHAARSVPAMIASNTSLGVAVLNHLAAQAAALLGSDFNVELSEAHHSAKRDAPSGTALRLAQALRDNAGVHLRPEQIKSVREGDIIGEHTVQFTGPDEIITIAHSATNRDLFARGALRAAAWLVRQPAGRYTIEQSLGLT